jgi:hypothetical protein
MSEVSRRPNRTPRRRREQRAFRLVQVGGIAAVVAVVGLVLSIVGILSSAVWVLAAVIAAVCGLLFWRTVN